MKKSMQGNHKIETGLIVRKETVFSKMKRIWNILLYKEEANFFQKVEKYMLKNRKPKGEIIIPQEIQKEKIQNKHYQEKEGEIKNMELKENKKTEIIIASGNKGKIKEAEEILKEYTIIPMKELRINIDVEEDQDTFEKNAIKKATEISKAIQGKMCMADDTGIEIEYLDGFPGVYTKRWHAGTDRERNLEILKRLEDVPKEKRKVKFVTAIAVAKGDETIVATEVLNGYIAEKLRGENGFGFDEIFELDNGKTLAELSSEEKNEISSRRKAIEKVREELEKITI